MFRVMELADEQAPRLLEGPEHVEPPAEGLLCWIDVMAPDAADLALLGKTFGFHPLALEDCAHQDQRPKAEEYGNYMFVVTQGFQCANGDLTELKWHELHTFLGPNYVVTVHDGDIPGLDQTWKRLAHDPALLRRGPDFVYYLLADRMVDDNFPILDRLGDELEALEDSVLTKAAPDELTRIFALKNHLVLMRKVLSPQREVMAMLARRDHPLVAEKTAPYFRDVYDHLARAVESIEANRDLLGNALDAYLSATGQRTNEIMKALAIMSAVFMPLTFITGFFGQNFAHLPFNSDLWMWTMLFSLVALPAALLLWFKSRNWF